MIHTYGEFGVDHVLDMVRAAWGKRKSIYLECGGSLFVVRASSQRYRLFMENRKCVCCGVEGTKFLLQSDKRRWIYYDEQKRITYPIPVWRAHFNLFGERNGGKVMLTKDHIKPVSLGGRSIMPNYQTLCALCNRRKGAMEIRYGTGEGN